MKIKPKNTVYIPCNNYGRYLSQAIESVINQTVDDWELIIINDGSNDNTSDIIKGYLEKFSHLQITSFSNEIAKGLRFCANQAIDYARGEYIIRLDADDYFDENALLVLSHFLDNHPDVGLVYPNYVYIDEVGRFLSNDFRPKIGKEVQLLNLPAHGACTMVRKRILKSIGGYDEKFLAQDGYELWLKVINRYQVANVSTPLFYYRQHECSLTKDENRLIASRIAIKRDISRNHLHSIQPRIVGIIPAKNTYKEISNIVLTEIHGRKLIDYSIDIAKKANIFNTILVTTDDLKVQDYCINRGDVIPYLRPTHLSLPHVLPSQIVYDALRYLENEKQIFPDILVLLSNHSLLRNIDYLKSAIDSLLLFNTDSVISVLEDNNLHFVHGKDGLILLNESVLKKIKLEREAIYSFNDAFIVLWRDIVSEFDIFGKKIGHVVLPTDEIIPTRYLFDKDKVDKFL